MRKVGWFVWWIYKDCSFKAYEFYMPGASAFYTDNPEVEFKGEEYMKEVVRRLKESGKKHTMEISDCGYIDAYADVPEEGHECDCESKDQLS